MSTKELVYAPTFLHQPSTEWKSQGRRSCSTPSSDGPSKPSPYYLQEKMTRLITLSATFLSQPICQSYILIMFILFYLINI